MFHILPESENIGRARKSGKSKATNVVKPNLDGVYALIDQLDSEVENLDSEDNTDEVQIENIIAEG